MLLNDLRGDGRVETLTAAFLLRRAAAVRFQRGIRGESCRYLIRVSSCNSSGDNGNKSDLPTHRVVKHVERRSFP
jgi:hypothetical protein